MLPVERQKRIKTLIRDRKTVKISELSAELNVSEMTVHRDLKPLISEGFVLKTFGGVTLNDTLKHVPPDLDECVICRRAVQNRLAYRIIYPDQRMEMACCAHCGFIRHNQIANDVAQAMCYDFLMATTINVPEAWFVMDTSINIGCCQPQVLPFELKDHAEKFVRGFGGNVYTFEEALEAVDVKMHGHCGCKSQSKDGD